MCPAILAVTPDGMAARVVLYDDGVRVDTKSRPKIIAVALESEFAARYPNWPLFHVHVTENQFTAFENFRLKREGGVREPEVARP